MPRRRCVGCGRIAAKSQLVRIVAERPRAAAGGSPLLAVLDSAGTLPGRGAYVCREAESERPAAECVAEAVRRRAFARALRATVTLDPKIVESESR